MYKLDQLDAFADWFASLRDQTVKVRLLARLARLQNGNLGDHKTIDGQLMELRMTFGGGLRVYYTIRGDLVVLLLMGGDKSSQTSDIAKAKKLLKNLEE